MNQLGKTFSAIFLAVSLMSVVGCSSTPQKEGTGEYIDDSVITTKVKTAIFNESTLKSAEINVETFKGVVQLSGFVNSQADINKAFLATKATAARRSWPRNRSAPAGCYSPEGRIAKGPTGRSPTPSCPC